MKICNGPLCDKPATVKGLCPGHRKQQKLGKVLTPLRRYRTGITAPEGYAYCTRCEAFKPIDNFYVNEYGKPRYTCKPCTLAVNKENTEKRKQRLLHEYVNN